MDKHTRPYVCEERGCEKINGFTYSGGLLRHQREVHKKHGGPKASWLCPYKDCKRSTGPEFSRKENLEEHLRRRHRGVEEAGKEDEMPKPEGRNSRKRRREPTQDEESQKSAASDSKKRKKAEENEQEPPVEDTEQASDDLQVQLKHLQQELQRTNDRLQKVEEVLAKLTSDKDL